MNWDLAEGKKPLKGKVRQQWGKLTDDEIDQIAEPDQLVGRIQNSYGVSKDEADKQLRDRESQQKE